MIHLDLPGYGKLQLAHLVCDYNGVLALDGQLIKHVTDRMFKIANTLNIHILTADTFDKVTTQTNGLPCRIHILGAGNERNQKKSFIQEIGPESVIAFGNGNNDSQMLALSRIGVAVIGAEGCAGETMRCADIIVNDIIDGLDLLLHPMRLKASLRF